MWEDSTLKNRAAAQHKLVSMYKLALPVGEGISTWNENNMGNTKDYEYETLKTNLNNCVDHG